MQERQQKLQEQEKDHMKKMQNFLVYNSNKNSDKLVENMLRQSLGEIFSFLDSDNDNVISSEHIDISSLPAEVLENLSLLLIEMDQMGETLDQEEFIDSAMRLYPTLNVHQKNTLLNFKKEQNKLKNSILSQEPQFKPKINQKSLNLAN
mmetsp:Transcript_7635/g.7013  ORF Transcript_7635/g.7013 Transcript_7635/m.7013 type:complete len:149 (-) Transcript_7635:269-715(-)